MFKCLFLVFQIIIFTMTLRAEEASIEKYVLCKSGKIVRTIRVEKSAAGVCETFYTKSGKSHVIGTVQFDKDCFRFIKNVQANLEQASWKCRDLNSVSIEQGVADVEAPEVADEKSKNIKGENAMGFPRLNILPESKVIESITNASLILQEGASPRDNKASVQ